MGRDDGDVAREAVEPVVREVVDERLDRYRREVAVVVAAVVGGGLTVAFALGMAAVALLAPDTWTVLATLAVLGTLLLAGGLWLATRDQG